MNDRIEMRKALRRIASSLSGRRSGEARDVLRRQRALEEAQGDEWAISLHEFVYIMKRAEISGFDAGVMTRLEWLSRQTFPHSPELLPFADLWKATFNYDTDLPAEDYHRTWKATITTRSILNVLDETGIPLGFDGLRLPLDCQLEEVSHWVIGTVVLPETRQSNHYCTDSAECAPGQSLTRFLKTMGITLPMMPPMLWERLKYPRQGLWQASIGDENDDSRYEIDPTERDHFKLRVAPDLAGPAGALDINVSFGLGPTRCSWRFTTTSDYLDDPSFIDRWHQMMEHLQIVMDASARLAPLTASDAVGERRILWQHLDTLGHEGEPVDILELTDPATGEKSFPDPYSPQEAIAQFLAACEKIDGGSVGGGHGALSRADKDAFLARWQDRPEIQAWTDEQIMKAISAGM